MPDATAAVSQEVRAWPDVTTAYNANAKARSRPPSECVSATRQHPQRHDGHGDGERSQATPHQGNRCGRGEYQVRGNRAGAARTQVRGRRADGCERDDHGVHRARMPHKEATDRAQPTRIQLGEGPGLCHDLTLPRLAFAKP